MGTIIGEGITFDDVLLVPALSLIHIQMCIRDRKKPLQAKFYGTDKKLPIHNKAEMDELLGKLENAEYEITEVKKGERIKNAPLPFTTSTLQQEAAKTLNFSTQKTMRLAQQLYEGIDIKGSGTVGPVSYTHLDVYKRQEQDTIKDMRIVQEMYARGLEFMPIDLYQMCIRDSVYSGW